MSEQAFNVEQAIEAISDRVHQGWMKEKLAQGFADHPWIEGNKGMWCYKCHRPPEIHHSDMLPYAELPDHIKEYDRKTARMVFEWLTENGYEVVTKEAKLCAYCREEVDGRTYVISGDNITNDIPENRAYLCCKHACTTGYLDRQRRDLQTQDEATER